jgi:hypothetical protein
MRRISEHSYHTLGDNQLDDNAIKVATVIMRVAFLHHDASSDDPIEQLPKRNKTVSNFIVCSEWGAHVAKVDPKWLRHNGLLDLKLPSLTPGDVCAARTPTTEVAFSVSRCCPLSSCLLIWVQVLAYASRCPGRHNRDQNRGMMWALLHASERPPG